jgi:actin-related protein
MDQNQYIVIDNGTSQIKIGYSGENQPRACVDSISGKVTPVNQGDGTSNKPYYIYGHNLKNALAENKQEV